MTGEEILKELQATLKDDCVFHNKKRKKEDATEYSKTYHNGLYSYAKQMYETVSFKLIELEA